MKLPFVLRGAVSTPLGRLIECAREEDGRWIAELPELPGVMCYGANEAQARQRATILALEVMADRLQEGAR